MSTDTRRAAPSPRLVAAETGLPGREDGGDGAAPALQAAVVREAGPEAAPGAARAGSRAPRSRASRCVRGAVAATPDGSRGRRLGSALRGAGPHGAERASAERLTDGAANAVPLRCGRREAVCVLRGMRPRSGDSPSLGPCRPP